jgi:hypothetical protein
MAQKCIRPDVSPAAVDPRALRSKEETDRVVRLFEAFEGLVVAASSVHVSRVVDEEDDMVNTRSQIRCWDVTVIHENGKASVFQSKTLIEVIMKMVDGEQEKICEGCWETKLLPAFSVDRSRPDGRCRNCRRCESARVYRSQRKKSQPRIETAAPGACDPEPA